MIANTQAKQLLQVLRSNSVLLMKSINGSQKMVPFNFGLETVKITKQTYDMLEKASSIWQKLMFKASFDLHMIKSIMMNHLQSQTIMATLLPFYFDDKIREHQINKPKLMMCRFDYFIEKQVPKLIEYNCGSVSMAGISSRFQQSFQQRNPDNKNIKANQALNTYAKSIINFYQHFSIKGIFLALVLPNQPNSCDQNLLLQKIQELSADRYPIKCHKLLCCHFLDQIVLDQHSNLVYEGMQVGVLYFRAGYSSQCQLDIDVQNIIYKSNVVTVPWLGGLIVNTKRIQVELSKDEVMRKYLTSEECEILKKTVISSWDFSQNNNDQQRVDKLVQMMEQDPDKYILKPNQQGGGFNYFGPSALEKLKSLAPSQREHYILNTKVIPGSQQSNIVYSEDENNFWIQSEVSDSEYSIYGAAMMSPNGQLVENNVGGFLVRSKLTKNPEGGLMKGNGFLSALQILRQ